MSGGRPAAAPATVPGLFFSQAERRGGALALRHKVRGVWRRVTWSEYGLEVRRVASALLAAGLRPGDRVAILGQNRPEWLYCHLGTMAAGGVTCGIYPTSSPEQVRYLLGHSGARVLFLEDEEQVEKALPVLGDTAVERAVVWDPRGLWGFLEPPASGAELSPAAGHRNAGRVLLFRRFATEAEEARGTGEDRVRDAGHALRPHDPAMIIYTSGTTGPP
ncbi:MAG TPA: AMP-binding protein, partial [Vicinamibacteria bacterium]|nr:AMP-binding protein [Vicinamibacteria bacterium]